MQMNSGIILSGQQPDFVNVLRQSNLAASEANTVQDQNALRQLYAQQGDKIAAGDQNALNALAMRSPQASLGIQDARQGLEAGQLNMDATRQRMDVLTAQERRAVEDHAAGLDATQRAAEADKIKTGVFSASAAKSPEEWDQIVTQEGVPQLAGQFASKDQMLRKYMTVAQIIAADAPAEPADEYGRYAQEQARAGLPALSRIDYAQAKKGKGTVVYDPTTGKPLVSIGGGGNSDPADATNPMSPAAMSNTIEGILNDPALDTATGLLEFTQSIPGTSQKRFGTRVDQLNGQAFLQAFRSLKGGGQITEIEGQKATQAIGRLDTAQSAEDYRQALIELKDVLDLAAQRPVGWAEQQTAAPNEIPQIADESGYNALPSGSIFLAPDGTQRRKP